MAITSLNFKTLLLLLLPLILTQGDARGLRPPAAAAEFLNPQNVVRASVGLPPLRWDSTLASYARWYAGQRRGDCALLHSDSNYGENLFWGEGSGWSIGAAVEAWAAERPYYDYYSNQCLPNTDCLHYTQMVWRDTKRVGCAKVICNNRDTFIACEYDPHGNVIGQRPY